jgi:hypothetical protein
MLWSRYDRQGRDRKRNPPACVACSRTWMNPRAHQVHAGRTPDTRPPDTLLAACTCAAGTAREHVPRDQLVPEGTSNCAPLTACRARTVWRARTACRARTARTAGVGRFDRAARPNHVARTAGMADAVDCAQPPGRDAPRRPCQTGHRPVTRRAASLLLAGVSPSVPRSAGRRRSARSATR